MKLRGIGMLTTLAMTASLLWAPGCASPEEGAVVGAVTGAAVGILAAGALGGPGGGPHRPGPGGPRGGPPHHHGPDPLGAALVGAGVGAVVGGAIGHQNQQQQQMNARISAAEQAARQQTVWVQNSNGSRTPVTLKPGTGGTWIGPKGETYLALPTQEQLHAVYGF